jgi:O-antigen ligase
VKNGSLELFKSNLRSRLIGASRGDRILLLVILFGCIIALALGRAVTMGGMLSTIAIALVLLLAIGAIAWTTFERRLVQGYLAVEVPTILLCISTLVLRQRDTETLADNPLDPAGLFRVVCVGGALMLGMASFMTPVDRQHAPERRITTRPFRLYVAYVFVVFLGTLFSVSPLLTAYRGIELLAAVAVVAGAARFGGTHALWRVENILYWFFVAIVASAWINILMFPGQALLRINSPLPYQLHGVIPAISSNGLGLLGCLLLFWSIARLMAPHYEYKHRPMLTKGIAVLGLITLVMAQYRTGYLAAVLGFVTLLMLRGRMAIAALILAVGVVGALWGPSLVETAQPVVLRGQPTDRAASLSGRVGWWTASIPVWKRSPIVGTGLLTGTRFEVLSALGRSFTSTIHGTWIEALVGTGIAGVALLAAFLATLWKRALVEALRPRGRILYVLVLTIFTVRTITGTTFEAAGTDTVLILTLALRLRDSMPARARLSIPQSIGAST